MIKFNQKACLKPYIDMNTDLKKSEKWRKIFLKLLNNPVFGKKTLENVIKHEDIRLVTPERRVYYLVSEPNFYTTKFFTEKLLAIKIKKETEILS